MGDSILKENQNKMGWDSIADEWFGATSLPTYGPTLPKEDNLNLFNLLDNKNISMNWHLQDLKLIS